VAEADQAERDAKRAGGGRVVVRAGLEKS
jgi:hypothetical protein